MAPAPQRKSLEPKSYAAMVASSSSTSAAPPVVVKKPLAPAAQPPAVTSAEKPPAKAKKQVDAAAAKTEPKPPSLYVNQLDDTVTKDQLMKAFSKVGKIKCLDHFAPKGYAFVEVSCGLDHHAFSLVFSYCVLYFNSSTMPRLV